MPKPSSTEDESHLRSKVQALEELLQVHEQVVLEQAGKLEKALAELTRSNRELQEFAYVASHDLQEPLRKILSFGDRLNAKYASALNEEGHDYLERMQKAARRMQALINDLLTYAQVSTDARPFINVDLNEVVADVLSDLEVTVGDSRALLAVGPLPVIQADPTQMRQLLQNLLGNALKFHQPGKPPVVKISASVKPADGADPASLESNGDICRLEVEDEGIGFEERFVDRIFGIFQRLHLRTEYEGTGVGLAICRKICERHGGSITARSSPGKGAVFIVTLPVEQGKG